MRDALIFSRHQRCWLSIAVMCGAMSLWVPASSAQSVDAFDENGDICSGLSSSGTDVNDGCLSHATSEGTIEIRKHVFGIESHITSCTMEVAIRIGGNGVMRIFEQVLAGASCSRRACIASGSEPTPWAASAFEGSPLGTVEGTLYSTTNFCFEPVGGGTDEICEVPVPFQSYSNQHRQEYGHATELISHGPSGFRCEIVGHWNSETGGFHDGQAEQEVEVIH